MKLYKNTTYAEYEWTTQNITRTFTKRDQPHLDICDRLELRVRASEISTRNSEYFNFTIMGEQTNGCYRFLEEVYCPANIPTKILQYKSKSTLHSYTENITVLTRKKDIQRLGKVVLELKNEGFRENNRKAKRYKEKQIVIRPIKKTGTIKKTKTPKKLKNGKT